MRSRYKIVDSDGIYFLTATIVEWIPLFVEERPRTALIESLAYCRAHMGLRIYAYVLMENHLHLVAECESLSRTIQSFKRHTAKEILLWAETNNKAWVLNQLAYFRKNYKRESKHQVWQEGVHPQLMQDDNMLRQKIQYIHENPVRRGWVSTPEDWRYSSASDYMAGRGSVLDIDSLPL